MLFWDSVWVTYDVNDFLNLFSGYKCKLSKSKIIFSFEILVERYFQMMEKLMVDGNGDKKQKRIKKPADISNMKFFAKIVEGWKQ